MAMGSYNSKITDEALILTDIFGIKTIPWVSIVSMSTVAGEGGVVFSITTSDKTFYVNIAQGHTVETFGNYIAEKSNLEVSAEAKPTLMKRWSKVGTNYKHSNYFDKMADSFYGIRSKEGMVFNYIAWGSFIVIAIIFVLTLF